MSPPSGTALIEAVRAGDQSKFEALLERHFRLVYLIALARLRSPEIAEDLAQEVFLQTYLHLGELAEPAQFGSWVARVARSLAIDWLRRGQSGSRLLPLVPLDDATAERVDSKSLGVRDAMAAEQESEALRRAILDLPPEQREVILLHHSEDLSQREIAERLGVHQATVSQRGPCSLSAGLHGGLWSDCSAGGDGVTVTGSQCGDPGALGVAPLGRLDGGGASVHAGVWLRRAGATHA